VRSSIALFVLFVACTPQARHEMPALPPPAVAEDPPAEKIAEPPPPTPEPTPPKPKRPGAYANVDPDDDYVVGPPDPIEDCEGELKKAGVTFHTATLAVHEEGKKTKILCGAPQVVTYLRGPGAIAYNGAPLLTCTMALALAQWEKILQEESLAIFKTKVASIEHIGTYSCREMMRFKGWVSEHAYANAIDIGSFVLKDGRTINVYRDFDIGDDTPKKAAGQFLRVVSRRANDEDVFSHVLTPFYDAIHKNHFHLDLSRYRADGTRPQG
jgi:hypothetical protein